MNLTDKQLKSKTNHFQTRIKTWLESLTEDIEEKLEWYSFTSWAEHFDDEPEDPPCVLVMCMDELVCELFNNDDEFFESFETIVDKSPFYFEQENSTTVCFYADDNDLEEAYRDYFEWQWICVLTTPDYADLYEELFIHFVKHPNDLHRLPWRKFENLLDAVFRNNGYETRLGPGTGDGGVDIHLYTKDALGDIVTLVQAKRYAEKRPIQLEAVAALSGHVHDQKANEGLFVTTSRFLPSARRFAERQSKKLTLATKPDIIRWSKKAATRIIRDKSKLITDKYIRNLLTSKTNSGFEGKVVYAHKVYGAVDYNEFCLVLKETPGSALLMHLPEKTVKGVDSRREDPDGQYGFKVPILNASITKNRTDDKVFRAKKLRDGPVTRFWGERTLYSLWDGAPKFFNSMD